MVQNDKIGQMTFKKVDFLDQKFEKIEVFEVKKCLFHCVFGPKGIKNDRIMVSKPVFPMQKGQK